MVGRIYCFIYRAPTYLEAKENLFKILDFAALDFDPFRLEQVDFFPDRASRHLPFKSPHPTGCGNNPVSGHLRRIGVIFHGLADAPVGFGSQGMGDFFISCHPAGRHLPQQIVGLFGKCFHFLSSPSQVPAIGVAATITRDIVSPFAISFW